MDANKYAIQLIEELNLGFHLGSAIIAIAEGDTSRARYHIERADASGATAPRPMFPMPVEHIPDVVVTQGLAPVRRGEKRVCPECSELKGATGFARGAKACRTCERSGGGRREVRQSSQAHRHRDRSGAAPHQGSKRPQPIHPQMFRLQASEGLPCVPGRFRRVPAVRNR